MANAILRNYDGGTEKAYKIQGLLNIKERKQQQSIDLPFPFLADNAAVINSIFGQVRIFNCSFIILLRSDDYTNGTGSPSNYSAYEQRTYLFDSIFKPRGYNTLTDEEETTFNGRIEDLEIVRSGDDPVKYDCTFTFKRGIVPTAGQFSPF